MSSEWGTIIVGGRPGHRCSFLYNTDAIIVGWHKMSLKNSIKLAILGNSDGHMILTQNMKATKMQSFQPLNFLP
ncbi:hypothetical protein E1A91_D04G086900v1 [Gossypium mustelinum]|uniref:Uncharacterized protein n=2 Tax=Gossypium TaxID=3633 RepID=A0A5J5RTE4_GOSBA|nr:hypothetical protein ES319_D04G086200v1 [Gossypium barbadense]TYI86748.1 hypothetical protein E1A91_D04G086900v1 [Gossypium mustelinum]